MARADDAIKLANIKGLWKVSQLTVDDEGVGFSRSSCDRFLRHRTAGKSMRFRCLEFAKLAGRFARRSHFESISDAGGAILGLQQ